jgi:hypothetical protein
MASAVDLVAVYGLHQTQVCHLDQVVELGTTLTVAPGDRLRDMHVEEYNFVGQPIALVFIGGLGPATQHFLGQLFATLNFTEILNGLGICSGK